MGVYFLRCEGPVHVDLDEREKLRTERPATRRWVGRWADRPEGACLWCARSMLLWGQGKAEKEQGCGLKEGCAGHSCWQELAENFCS